MIKENSKIKNIKKNLERLKRQMLRFLIPRNTCELDSVLKITAFYHFKKIVISFSILEINSIEYIL